MHRQPSAPSNGSERNPYPPYPHEEEREEDAGRRVLSEALEEDAALTPSDVHVARSIGLPNRRPYKEVLALSVWVRRRVRLYYWKQWKQPRTRRRHLLALGADPETIHMATRSRKGYWRMSQNEIVRFALNNRWLEEQGVPDLRAIWIKLHYGPDARV